jgi:hypothetical protein
MKGVRHVPKFPNSEFRAYVLKKLGNLGTCLTLCFFSACSSAGRRGEDVLSFSAEADGVDETSSRSQARAAAVEGALDLFLSSAAFSAGRSQIELKILPRSKDFIVEEKELLRRLDPGRIHRKIEAVVRVGALEQALDALGLVRPEGVGLEGGRTGRPIIALALSESCEKSPEVAGRASAVLRLALSGRGYSVVEFKEKAGGPKPLAWAKEIGAAAAVIGTVEALPLSGDSFSEIPSSRASVLARLVWLKSDQPPTDISRSAEAFDLTDAAACSKALSDAGLLVSDQVRALLGSRFSESSENALFVEGLGGISAIRRFLSVLRSLPHVSAAVLSGVSGADVKFIIFGRKLSADELAAEILRLPNYSFAVHVVDSESNLLELEKTSEKTESLENTAPPSGTF